MLIISGKGATCLYYDIRRIGPDIIVTVTGGDNHVGAVVVAEGENFVEYRKDKHHDSALAFPLAKKLAAVGRVCVVAAGFHLDDISKQEIDQVLKNHETGMDLVLDALKSATDTQQQIRNKQ